LSDTDARARCLALWPVKARSRTLLGRFLNPMDNPSSHHQNRRSPSALHYRVFESSHDGTEVALLDTRHRCHIARRAGSMPCVGVDLAGPKPVIGAVALRCMATQRVFELNFVAIDCDRQRALERLHPTITR
jgi:hypothetical protein